MNACEILANEVSSITDKSRKNILAKFKLLDEVSANDFYIFLLKQIMDLISADKIIPLKHINWLLTEIGKYKNEKDFQKYFKKAKTHFQNFNVIILACRSKAKNALHNILTDTDKILYNLSCKIHDKDILPSDEDEFHHSAFYYAIRSNIVYLLDKLIDLWPNKYLEDNLEELDYVLAKSYKELKLRNVFLSKEMELYVQSRIFNIRFFHKNSKDVRSGNSIINIEKRIDLVIENIQLIKSSYLDTDPDEEFILVAEFIAKNIHVLKSDLKSTYDKIPWEEIEFCLVIFIQCCKKYYEANLVYNTVLKKEKILTYLEKFSNILESEKKNIVNTDMKTLRKSLDSERHAVVEKMIQRDFSLQNLYQDYEKVRDFCSLETIQSYTNLAVAAEPSVEEERLLIIRALQVTGEHVKDTHFTPKLSRRTAHLLLFSLPLTTRRIIEKLRDSLSHENYLSARSELETEACNFFKEIQADISKMNGMATEILSKIKKEQMKVLLLNLKQCKYWRDVKDLLETYFFSVESFSAELKKLDPNDLIKRDVERLQELLLNFFDQAGETISYEKKLFEEINEKIRTEKSVHNTEIDEISLLIRKLYMIFSYSKAAVDMSELINYGLMPFTIELSDISYVTVSNVIKSLVIELLNSVTPRIEQKNLELWNIVWKIYHLIEFQMNDVKWIKEYADFIRPERQEKTCFKEIKVQDILSSKISLLKKILKENNLMDSLIIPNVSFFESNKKLQSVIEMLSLDICNLLSDSFTYNNFFLDDDYIIQTGYNLRNNLAHINIMINYLSPLASLQLLLNAQKLVNENFKTNSRKIGQVKKCDPNKLKDSHDKNLFIIRNQKAFFAALSEGNMENIPEYLRGGADIFGRDLKLMSCLHFSSKAPKSEAIECSIKQVLDVNCKDFNDRTALHVAVEFERLETVEFLLQNGAFVNSRDAEGITPLHIAAEKNNEEIVKLLMKHEAHTSNSVFRFPPLHYAIFKGSIEVAEILAENETNVDKIKAYGGLTALCMAAAKGEPYLVRLLLGKKASIYSRDDFENTPLHYAAMYSHQNVVEILVSEGADVNARNFEGDTPLGDAAKIGNETIVKFLLLHKADIGVRDSDLSAPIHFATAEGNAVIVELFLNMDSTLAQAMNRSGYTPLHIAAMEGHEQLVNILLKHNAKADSQDNDKRTALHMSARNGFLDIAKSLIEAGCNVGAQTTDNLTPLNYAVERGHFHLVEFLISKGADIHSAEKGFTYLYLAASRGHKDIVKLLLTRGAKLRNIDGSGNKLLYFMIFEVINELFLEKKTNFDFTVVDNFELFLTAAIIGHKAMIELCLEKGCKVNARNNSGLTALHFAAANNHQELVTFLLDKGADIYAKGAKGETVLYSAVECHAAETVRVLINKQAKDVQSFVDDRNEALFLAAQLGYDDIVSILFQNCEFDVISLQKSSDFLHRTSQYGHRKVVEKLLENKFEVDALWNSFTPLQYAAMYNRCEITRLLIKKGANVNAQNEEGMTAFHWIAEEDNLEMAHILLNGGADVSIRDKKYRSVTEVAVHFNQLGMVKLLSGTKNWDINLKGNKGFTLLHIAAEIGSLEITKYLCLKGANINEKDMNGSRPIHIAAEKGHKDIVGLYLDKNVNINNLGSRNFTPLHFSVLGGMSILSEYLIERGADLNAIADDNMTPVHLATVNGNEEVFRILLHNGAYYNSSDQWNSSLLSVTENKSIIFLLKIIDKLFIAVQNNNPSEVELLLKEAERHSNFIISNARCVINETSLLYASRKGYEEVVEILLKFRANPNMCDKEKLTPLHYAAKLSNLKIAKELLKNGAMYNKLCSNGKYPIEYATDETIFNLLDFAHNVFTKIENNDNYVLTDLKDKKNQEFSKLLLRAKDRNGNSLIEAAILSRFSQVEQLTKLFQDDVLHLLKSAEDLINQHKFAEAYGELKIVLDRRMELFGLEDPATLDVFENTAVVLLNLEKNNKALDLLQNIYQKRNRIFPEYHTEILNIKYMISLVLHRQGRNAEAFQLLKEVLKYKNLYENNYFINMLYSGIEMSSILTESRNFDEALKISHYVLCKCKNEYGLYHEITLRALDNKAVILEMQGKFSEAKKVFEKVFHHRSCLLPPYHTNILRSRIHIAQVLHKLRYYDYSLKMCKNIREILKRHYPPNHLNVFKNESNIGKIFHSQGRSIKALKIFLALESKISNCEELHFLEKTNKSDIETVFSGLRLRNCEWIVDKIREELKQNGMENHTKNFGIICENNKERKITLHAAVENGERGQINNLLKKGADIFMVSNEGNTALHLASARGYDDIVEIIFNYAKNLSSSAKNVVNARNNTFSTPLHLVSNVRTAISLLKHGAIYDARNDFGQTPMDLAHDEKILKLMKLINDLFEAVKSGTRDIVQELDGSDPEDASAATNARNSQNHSLVQVAIKNRHFHVARGIINCLKNKACKKN